MHFLHHQLSRRTLLKAGAVSLALPWLEMMLAPAATAAEREASQLPRRLLLIGRVLGTNGEYFFPTKTGLDYEPTRYLKLLESHRGRFTVFSGLSHLGYPNSHHTEAGLFSGMSPDRVQRLDDIRPTVSLDQWVAAKIGSKTRLPSLTMGDFSIAPMVYDTRGVAVPLEQRPEETFRRLFLQGSPDELAREVHRLKEGRSILDLVRDQLKRIRSEAGAADRDRLDLLTSSVRDAERELQQRESWVTSPKPKVDRSIEAFRNPDWSSSQKMRYDLAFLAFQTDSTRVAVAIEAPGNPGDAPGTQLGHHDASHHGRDPRKVEQYARFEEEETRNVAALLDKLGKVQEGDSKLLDRTVVFWGSNLGNPSAHASSNLPILVAGGGFRHQGHIAYDEKNNRPLSNLYVRLLHQLGIEEDRFGSSTGVLSDLS